MPLFSIVVVHYQEVNSHATFLRGIASLQAQTFRDFEILCYHDGPLLEIGHEWPVAVRCTAKRYNDWGHSLRDLGIRDSTGEYIRHFNADNVLCPDALQVLAAELAREPRLRNATGQVLDTDDIVIFPIRMWGLVKFRQHTIQFKGTPDFFLILTGTPPVLQNIDCMQLVMKRSLWLAEGGWHDRRELGDGFMYQAFAGKYGYRSVGPVLGEHF